MNAAMVRTPAAILASARPFGLTLYCLVFFSGALALVYEILWMRRFAVVFGAATPAVAATLAALFLGFTTGSLVIGVWAIRAQRPLRSYGWLEIGVGAGALLVEPMLKFYDAFYPNIYQAMVRWPLAGIAIKVALVMAALFLPAFCMGGSIPMLAQAIATEQRRLGMTVGGLYAANIFGAALGALSVPFLWLPHLSARKTYAACIAGSCLTGLIAWTLAPALQQSITALHLGKNLPSNANKGSLLSPGFLSVQAALSGTLFFILQVAWSRMFAQVHEDSIYSFSVVLAVLLAGLATGAWLARELLRRGRQPVLLLGISWLMGGAAVFLVPQLFCLLTNDLSYIKGHGGWASYGLRILWLTAPTVFFPSLLVGMILPLLMDIAGVASGQPSGRVLGGLLAANTLGAIAGSLLAAFVLPPWLGMWGGLLLVALAMIAAGDLCLSAASPGRLSIVQRTALYGAIALALLFANPLHLSRTKLHVAAGETLLSLQEGSQGIVAVVEKDGSRRIKLDNYYVLGGTASVGDERMQAHLPLLLHPAPKRVAFLGLGTAITAGAALLHPVQRITAVEIVPEVFAAARDYFTEANLNVLRSNRTQVVIEDARNFLRGAGQEFDVIVGDLVVPWRRGEASLYTLDHFATVRRALAPGGIFCQWLPMFQLSEEEFNMIAATFLDVFPSTTLWRGDFAPDRPALALIGQFEAAPLDPEIVERRIRELQRDETNPSLAHPAGFWMYLAGPLDAKEPRFAHVRLNRENEPWLEILGPLNHAGSTDGVASLFVGRSLESFLNDLRARPVIGTPLARLESAQLRWRELGANLGAISILTSEGRRPEAQALMQQTLSGLPPDVRNLFDAPQP